MRLALGGLLVVFGILRGVLSVNGGTSSPCLQLSDAQQVAANLGLLVGNYSDTLADYALAPDYTQYSTSLNSERHSCSKHSIEHPILSPIFSSREEFKRAQGMQQTSKHQQLNLWHSCDTVVMRYQFTFEPSWPKPIVSMASVRTTPAPPDNPYPYWINVVYNESDLKEYCEDIGWPIPPSTGV